MPLRSTNHVDKERLKPFMEFDFGIVAIVISFLDVMSLCMLDSALTNRLGRQHWLDSIKLSSSKALEEWRHRDSMQSLLWLSSRKPNVTKVLFRWNDMMPQSFLEYPYPLLLIGVRLTDLSLSGHLDHRFLSDIGLEQLKAGAFINLEKFGMWLGAGTRYTPSPEAFTTLVQCCPKLKSIRLTGYAPLFMSEHLRVIAQDCPHLEYLALPLEASVTDWGLRSVAENCPCLKEIRILQSRFITDMGLVMVADCPLEKVDICCIYESTTDGIVSMIRKIASTLRSLRLTLYQQRRNYYDMVEIIKELTRSRCVNLEIVDLSIYEIYQPLPLKELLRCCNKLREVRLHCYSEMVRYTEEEVVGDGGLLHLKLLFPLVTFVNCGPFVRRSKRLRKI